jgi:predicted anti-sigma-YlaC factor YlaD
MSKHDQLTCHDILGSLGDYLDGNLRADLCEEIENHMRGCENCRVVVDTTSKTIYLYHHTAREVELPNGARERLFSALKLDDFILPKR